LYQLLKDGAGNEVAEISMFGLPEGSAAAAGATIVVPLETLLTPGLRLAVDGGETRTYPFTFCNQAGCVARIGFRAEEVASFKRGAKAVLSIVPARAPDQVVNLDVSLNGFTAGYDAVAAQVQ
jgi:invasion protein IalB